MATNSRIKLGLTRDQLAIFIDLVSADLLSDTACFTASDIGGA